MKTCWNCHTANVDEAGYCASCGADLSTGALAEEKRFLDDCRRSLGHERRALRIVGIVFIVFCAIMMLMLLLMFLNEAATVSFIIDDVGDGAADDIAFAGAAVFMLALIYLFVYFAVFLASGIVNLVSASRTGKMLDMVYTDLSAVNKRNGSAKRIVFAAFFNTIAMIFIIINFSRLKKNSALVERIIARQNASQNENTFG